MLDKDVGTERKGYHPHVQALAREANWHGLEMLHGILKLSTRQLTQMDQIKAYH